MKTCNDCGCVISDRRAFRCSGCAASTVQEAAGTVSGPHLPGSGGRPLQLCANCDCVISYNRKVCGECSWIRSRPERLKRRVTRDAR